MHIQLVPLPSRTVDVARGPLALAEHGPADGPVALFVPGFTGSKEDFALVAQPLAMAGLRYVAIDQRGQYESPGPDDPAAYGVEALAADLLDVVAEVGGQAPVHVVGHSFGGLVARRAALLDPGALASVVLMDSGPAALSGPRVDAMEALRPVLASDGMGAVFDAVAGMRGVDLGQEVMAFLRHRWVRSSAAGLLGMGEAIKAEPDLVAALRATGLPALVLCGEHDDAWPPYVQREMAARLGAPYVEIAGAVHSPAAEKPAETAAALVAFWRSLG